MKTELEKLRAKSKKLKEMATKTGCLQDAIKFTEQRSECLKAIGTLTIGKFKTC